MADIREALMEVIANRTAPNAADAILAEFDVTPPTVKPSVEDVARRHSRVSMDGTCICGAVGIGFVLGYGEHLVAETLALLPGRDAVEVKAEAWDEGFVAGVNTDMGDHEHPPEEYANPYRQGATRG